MRKLFLALLLILLVATVHAETIQEKYEQGKTYNHSSGIEFSGYYYNSASDSVVLRFSWMNDYDYLPYSLQGDRDITESIEANYFHKNNANLLYWEIEGVASGSTDTLEVSFTITTLNYKSTYVKEIVQFGVEHTTLAGYNLQKANASGNTKTEEFKSPTKVKEVITASHRFGNSENLYTTELSSSNPSVTYTLQYNFVRDNEYSYPRAGTVWKRKGIVKFQIKYDWIKNLPAGQYVGTIAVEVSRP